MSANPSPRALVADFGSPVLAAAPHRIGTVSLVVHDLDLVSRFYQDVVGLSVLSRSDATVRLGAGNATLLELRGDPAARRRSPRDAGLFHTAFLLPSREDLGAWIAYASERRFQIQGASDHGVSEALYLADPEGNGIEIYADRPAATWKQTGPTIEMVTEPLDMQDLYNAGLSRRWAGYPEDATVGHLHLQVGALSPAENFYAGLLGFDVSCRYPGAVFYGSGGYHHQLATNIWGSRGAPPRTDAATGLAAFELIARDSAVVDAARARLSEAGVALSERPGGFVVAEPFGTEVTLTVQPSSGSSR